jgi:hypothetical protein
MRKFVFWLIAAFTIVTVSIKAFAANKPTENIVNLGSFNAIELTADNNLTKVYANVGDKTLMTFELVDFKVINNAAQARVKASNGMTAEINVTEGENKVSIDGIKDGAIVINASVTKQTADYILKQLRSINL